MGRGATCSWGDLESSPTFSETFLVIIPSLYGEQSKKTCILSEKVGEHSKSSQEHVASILGIFLPLFGHRRLVGDGRLEFEFAVSFIFF
jgi:hypothetical protein